MIEFTAARRWVELREGSAKRDFTTSYCVLVMVLAIATGIEKMCGNSYLTVIERALHSQTMHVRVRHCGHLRLLYRTDFAVRKRDEDRDVLLASEPVDSGRASVAARSSNDCQMLPLFSCLALIPPQEEVFEQIPKELQRNIFESKRRTMEEFEEVDMALRVERNSGCDRGCAEGRVATPNDAPQVLRRDFGGRDVEGKDLKS